jgi:hypothetical protein
MPVRQYGRRPSKLLQYFVDGKAAPLMAGIPRCPGGERRMSPVRRSSPQSDRELNCIYAEHLRSVWKRRQQEAAALQ